MKMLFLAKQIANAVATTTSHLNEDRVFFSMQLARRLPKSISHRIAHIIGAIPGAANEAASEWLLGREDRAKAVILAVEESEPSRLLGEIALNLGLTESAERIANSLSSASALKSRVMWAEGNIDDSINVLQGGKRAQRLLSERQSMSPGWWPRILNQPTSKSMSRNKNVPLSALHVLTNSLPHTRSGYSYRSHNVLATLKDAGFRVSAATRPSYPVTIGRFSSGVVELVEGIPYLRDVPVIPAETPMKRLENQSAWIVRQAIDRKVDVIHTTTHFVNGLAAGSAAKSLGLPWVYEVRGVLEETWAAAGATPKERQARRSSQRFALMRAKEIEVATEADAVITLGETMREHLVEGGVPAESIQVIPNAVSNEIVNADTRKAPRDVRSELGLSRSGVWVGTAASIVGYEGLDDLVDAVIHARSSGVDLRLLIVGDGVALPALSERAQPLGDNVVFTGRVPRSDAIAYQLGLDTIVVPRKDEPVCRLVTPIKPVEAMGLGRPVVISDLPALREQVPESAGLWTPAQDPVQLAGTLAQLAESTEKRENYGQNGREHILKTCTWKAIGQRYGNVYSQITKAVVQ